MKLIDIILTELLIIGCFSSGCRQIFGDSEPPESIVQPPFETMNIIVSEPRFGTIKNPGETLSIEWTAPRIRKIDIQLFRKSEFKLTLIEDLENEGRFDWEIPNDIPLSNHYLLKIMSHTNNDIYDLSEQFGIQ